VFGHRLVPRPQKLEAGARDVTEHAGLEQQIGDAFHGVPSQHDEPTALLRPCRGEGKPETRIPFDFYR
jgi:hypothetical protein